MYALVEIKGKQYKVEKGLTITVDKLDEEAGASVEFTSVLLASDGSKIKVGKPFVKGYTVKGTVAEHKKDKKVTVMKYKRRKGYHRKQGHRQQYTVITVDDIIKA